MPRRKLNPHHWACLAVLLGAPLALGAESELDILYTGRMMGYGRACLFETYTPAKKAGTIQKALNPRMMALRDSQRSGG